MGRAALAIDSVLEEPSIAGIQALVGHFYCPIDFQFMVTLGLDVSLHVLGGHRRSQMGVDGFGRQTRPQCLFSASLPITISDSCLVDWLA